MINTIKSSSLLSRFRELASRKALDLETLKKRLFPGRALSRWR